MRSVVKPKPSGRNLQPDAADASGLDSFLRALTFRAQLALLGDECKATLESERFYI